MFLLIQLVSQTQCDSGDMHNTHISFSVILTPTQHTVNMPILPAKGSEENANTCSICIQISVINKYSDIQIYI